MSKRLDHVAEKAQDGMNKVGTCGRNTGWNESKVGKRGRSRVWNEYKVETYGRSLGWNEYKVGPYPTPH
jgi:hypothetical protein